MAAMMAIVGLIGTGIQVAGSMAQASAQKKQAEYNAQIQEKAGKIEFANAQREALQKTKEASLAESRARAIAAASGAGGVSSPTVMETIADIYGQGDYASRTTIAAGENQKEMRFASAALSRAQGKAAYSGSMATALGQGIGGFAKSMYG